MSFANNNPGTNSSLSYLVLFIAILLLRSEPAVARAPESSTTQHAQGIVQKLADPRGPTEAQTTVAHVPRWGAQLTASWSEAGAWATYRALQKQYAALIGDREPIILHGRFPGLGTAPRYMVRIAGDSRADLEKFCDKLIAAGGACAVLRNDPSLPISPPPGSQEI
jgi:hypothetical protein